MDNEFKQAESIFQELKEKYRQGEISRQDFLDEMKNLQVKDDQGRLWMIGSQSGKWYYLKGQEWVQEEPVIRKESEGACPYCGFENKPGAEACARCGGGLRGSEDYCIECGTKLQPPLYRCPVCDAPKPGLTPTTSSVPYVAAPTAPAAAPMPPPPPAVAPAPPAAQAAVEKKPALQLEKTAVQGEFMLRSVSASSFAFFGGALGIIVGIILGAFVGATDLLAGPVAGLPRFLADMQGTLIGAVVFAAAGGLAGFLALGLLLWLKGHFLNLLLSFIGGIKVRLEQASLKPKSRPDKKTGLLI